MSLKTLLGARQVTPFVRHAWPLEPFVVHGPVRRFKGLVDPASTLAQLFSMPAQMVYAQVRKGDRFQNTPISAEAAPALYGAGHSIYLWEVSLKRHAFLEGIRAPMGLRAGLPRVGIFASRPGVGAPLHFDSQESFVVQLKGAKEWTIAHNANIQFPTENHFAADPVPPAFLPEWVGAAPGGEPPGATKIVLEPGSVMFVPRGLWHSTRTIRDSVHVDLMMPLPSRGEVLSTRLGERLQQAADWRAPAGIVERWELEAEADRLADDYLARRQGRSKSRRASAKTSRR